MARRGHTGFDLLLPVARTMAQESVRLDPRPQASVLRKAPPTPPGASIRAGTHLAPVADLAGGPLRTSAEYTNPVVHASWPKGKAPTALQVHELAGRTSCTRRAPARHLRPEIPTPVSSLRPSHRGELA